jgi:peptide/nickel transport system substrate-binding protein
VPRPSPRGGGGIAVLRRVAVVAAAATLLLTVVSGSSGASPAILRIGTAYYVDTLNPFIGIETNDTAAYTLVYPQLVQYGPGLEIEGDWARSWTHSRDGLTWTFRLRAGGKWSDGSPLTAQDALWTMRAILEYRNGAASYLASALDGVKSVAAPDATTLVVHYARPVAPVLANLEQFFVLPRHVWTAQLGTNGKGLKTFRPERTLPLVGGGAYTVTQFEQKGTTVFKPNPYFYGPKSRAAAVTLTYYTNATSMTVDLEHGNLDYVDALPYKAADALRGKKGVVVTEQEGDEVTNLGFNSNPRKLRNRELLDPRLKEALEYAIPRQEIVDVVFGGHAKPWANIISPWSRAEGWLNPAVTPLPYSPAKANAILDSLGYKRGGNGVRVVPATSGRHAQGAHPMRYAVIVPNDLDFSGDRQFQILQTAFAKIGVRITETAGGDGSQAYELITAPNGKYLNADMYTWYWHPYLDPSFNLSVVTKAEWQNNSDTGFDDPQYDRWWKQQATTVDVAKRRALVWKMEAYLARKRPYIQLVDTSLLTAHASGWTGFRPNLWGYCKCFLTLPHPVR